jgi:hypothetical protein
MAGRAARGCAIGDYGTLNTMKRMTLPAICLLVFELNSASVYGQTALDRITVTGGVVDAFNAAHTPIDPHQPLFAGEIIRTSGLSFANLTLGVDGNATIGEQSEVEIRRLGPTPLIWLERGNLKISSKHTEIQIQTRSGLFSPAEWPYAIDLSNTAGAISLSVTEGSVQTSGLQATVSFRAAASGAYRTYSVGGGNNKVADAPAIFPGMYVQPCYGIPGVAPPPQNPNPTKPAPSPTPVPNPPKPVPDKS